jgi:hypothetical protein
LGGSNAFGTAINLLDQQLQIAIKQRMARWDTLCSILSALGHLDPFQVVATQKFCFLWITNILESTYAAGERYQMAGKAVELAWKEVQPEIWQPLYYAWVLPLVDFLQLSEELYSTESRSGALALRILSARWGPSDSDFGPKILPILASMLLPTHPSQSRRSALKIFHQFTSGWFSSQMECVSNEDRARLLQAVGDPFQSTPDPLLQDEQHVVTNEYEPTKAAVVLIEFASSGLWRDHLRCSNFASCEEVASTVEGKNSVFRYMPGVGGRSWLEFLCTPVKVIAAIERLEELQCLNTAEVVLMWVWTPGIMKAVNHNAWRLLGGKTLAFYQTHGMGRLKTLSRHIMDCAPHFTARDRWDPRCRVDGVRLPVRIAGPVRRLNYGEGSFSDFCLTQVCQLRRLYQLFECDPTTWGEVVAVERVCEETDVSLGQSPNPVHSMDCACDYP